MVTRAATTTGTAWRPLPQRTPSTPQLSLSDPGSRRGAEADRTHAAGAVRAAAAAARELLKEDGGVTADEVHCAPAAPGRNSGPCSKASRRAAGPGPQLPRPDSPSSSGPARMDVASAMLLRLRQRSGLAPVATREHEGGDSAADSVAVTAPPPPPPHETFHQSDSAAAS